MERWPPLTSPRSRLSSTCSAPPAVSDEILANGKPTLKTVSGKIAPAPVELRPVPASARPSWASRDTRTRAFLHAAAGGNHRQAPIEIARNQSESSPRLPAATGTRQTSSVSGFCPRSRVRTATPPQDCFPETRPSPVARRGRDRKSFRIEVWAQETVKAQGSRGERHNRGRDVRLRKGGSPAIPAEIRRSSRPTAEAAGKRRR